MSRDALVTAFPWRQCRSRSLSITMQSSLPPNPMSEKCWPALNGSCQCQRRNYQPAWRAARYFRFQLHFWVSARQMPLRRLFWLSLKPAWCYGPACPPCAGTGQAFRSGRPGSSTWPRPEAWAKHSSVAGCARGTGALAGVTGRRLGFIVCSHCLYGLMSFDTQYHFKAVETDFQGSVSVTSIDSSKIE